MYMYHRWIVVVFFLSTSFIRGHLHTLAHKRTFSRVSGSLRATRPPPTRAAKESRMGMALVMPTKLAKMELPSTAASLQRPLRTPNAVALKHTIVTFTITKYYFS